MHRHFLPHLFRGRQNGLIIFFFTIIVVGSAAATTQPSAAQSFPPPTSTTSTTVDFIPPTSTVPTSTPLPPVPPTPSPTELYAPSDVSHPNSPLRRGLYVLRDHLGLPSTDIRLIIANLIRLALSFVGIILLINLLFAGFLWMTSGGNDEQRTTAKKTILNSIVGLFIMLSAYSIVYFVIGALVPSQTPPTFPTEPSLPNQTIPRSTTPPTPPL